MKQFTLVKNGPADTAFRLEEAAPGPLGVNEVAIESEAFGINYADIMARLGNYRDAPAKPCVIGYEAVGTVIEVGNEVEQVKVGTRVAAFCRFGGYSQRVVTKQDAVTPIGDMDAGEALALTVQYSTAYYCAEDCVTIHPEDNVLVQAAAGGVGIALVQLAKARGATVFGTAGAPEKLALLRELGVDYPINYREEDFADHIKRTVGENKIDLVFDSLGGKEFRKGQKLLRPGGKIVAFGNASRSGGMTNIFGDIRTLTGFGWTTNALSVMESKAVIGVNMLAIADHRPHVMARTLRKVVDLHKEGVIKPHVGAKFAAADLAKAHDFVASRQSMGKVYLVW